MIDKEALLQKLTALAAEKSTFLNGARVIADGGIPTPMQAILFAIDESVLDRKLTFRIDASYATVVVAGRRLQGLVKASGDLDGALKIMGKILSHDDTELLDNLGAVMKQLASTEGVLTVTSEKTQKLGTQADAGVGIGVLIDHWGVDMATEPPTPMSQFIINCGASVNASLVIAQGEVIRAKGEKDIQDRLEHIANDQWSSFSDALTKLRKSDAVEAELVCVNGAATDAMSIAVARNEEELSVFMFAPDQLSTVYSKWRETTAA